MPFKIVEKIMFSFFELGSKPNLKPRLTLSTLCSHPAIKSAMDKEGVLESHLAETNINLEYLHWFLTQPDMDYYYKIGAFTFSEYINSPQLQEGLSYQTLFSSTGLYALSRKFVTIPQFLNLSEKARLSMFPIFKTADNDHGERDQLQNLINYIFSSGFDFKKYNEYAENTENPEIYWSIFSDGYRKGKPIAEVVNAIEISPRIKIYWHGSKITVEKNSIKNSSDKSIQEAFHDDPYDRPENYIDREDGRVSYVRPHSYCTIM